MNFIYSLFTSKSKYKADGVTSEKGKATANRNHPHESAARMFQSLPPQTQVMLLTGGGWMMSYLNLEDILKFSATCHFCERLFLDKDLFHNLMISNNRLYATINEGYIIKYENEESSLYVLRKLSHKIMKYNDNTAESKNDQSDTTSINESKKQEVTSGTTLSAYSDANEQTCAILDSNMIKLSVDNRIVLRITSDIFLEEAKYHDVEDGISGLNQASYDEFDDFKPEHLELKPTTESYPRRINSFFSSSGDLEEYTLKALSSMDKSLSELELWSLDRRSQSSDLGLSMHSTGSRCASPSRKPSTPRCMTSDQANFAGRTELDYDSDRSSGEDSSDAKNIVGLTFDDVMNPSE